MRGQPRGAFGLAAVLAALVCAGCGSSSTATSSTNAKTSGSTSASSTATKAQFVSRAEAVCRTLSAQEKPLEARQAALKGLSPDLADEAFLAIVDKVIAYSQTAAGKLAAIPRPAADAQAIEKLLSSFSLETADAKVIQEAARKQESGPGEDAQDALRKTIDDNLPQAEAYGMRDCIAAE
jgi:hypothetical protein